MNEYKDNTFKKSNSFQLGYKHTINNRKSLLQLKAKKLVKKNKKSKLSLIFLTLAIFFQNELEHTMLFNFAINSAETG